MANFKGQVKQCVTCGVSFKVPTCRAEKAICCSRKCKDAWWRTQRDKTISLVCQGCGTAFTEYASHVDRRVFCSRSCKAKHEIKPDHSGDKNPSWKGGKTFHDRGYIYVLSNGHPFAKNFNYVFEHRLVMEKWLLKNEPNSHFLVEIDGKKYLDPKIVVHHRNEIKSDNDRENLQCMTQAEHMAHHNRSPISIEKKIANLQRRLDAM